MKIFKKYFFIKQFFFSFYARFLFYCGGKNGRAGSFLQNYPFTKNIYVGSFSKNIVSFSKNNKIKFQTNFYIIFLFLTKNATSL